MSINKVILLGNVGKDPKITQLENDVKVASFSLATTKRIKRGGDRVEETEWHNIVAWRALADSVEKSELKKGDRVYVEGEIRTRRYTDKNNEDKTIIEIQADKFTIINRKRVEAESDTE